MRTSHLRKEAGFTFAELAFGMVILVLGAAVLVNHIAINYQTTNTERDRVFAYTKAQAILSEIQGFVDRGQVDAAIDLDVLDDGIVNKETLTITTDQYGSLVSPDHAISGNFRRDGEWVWSRRITVQPFVGLHNRNVRYVTVRVYRKDAAGEDHPLADLSAVINSAGSGFPTAQVFDVYLLAIENIPGWWVFMDSIQPFVESMITDLETRNPGLQFRTHWITKSSFGRNHGYRPYVNDDLDSHQAMPDVYHYPGRMPSGNASTYYYVPDNMRGRINADGTERNGYDDDLNPFPYALADFFNHGMRYPEEKALWQARVDRITEREEEIEAAIAAGSPPPPVLTDMSKEPTLRLFLEDLYSDPDKYRNALIINLHGELMPMPALRNFSDAAREPVTMAGVRVVTHPEELRTHRDPSTPGAGDSLHLRMYAFNSHNPSWVAAGGATRMSVPMVVDIVGMKLVDESVTLPGGGHPLASTCTLMNLKGGTPIGLLNDTSYDTDFALAKAEGNLLLQSGEMYYSAEYVDSGVAGEERFTRIWLYNTPIVCTQDGATRGLANTERALLYQMPYVPCPVESARDFSTNLGDTGVGPKNTARWRLRISPSVFTDGSFRDLNGDPANPSDDVVVTVRTRIWTGTDPGSSGTMWPPEERNQPDNLSVTYAWWADSAEDVPITERAQFNGDPRHVPYRDCFGTGVDYPDAYNWYHDALTNGSEPSASDYTSITAGLLRNRWASAMSCDVPRYFELLRKAMVRSAVVWTTLTGYSYYYLGIGNDIGYDSANGYTNSIPSHLIAHGSNSTGYINTITGSRRFVRDTASPYWWGIPWLGELFPDSAAGRDNWYSQDTSLVMRGNLPAGTSTNCFYQGTVNSVYGSSNRTAYGTAINNHHQRTANQGCTTLFNIGSSGSSFQHASSSGNGSMTSVGLEIASNYSMTMPTSAPVSRPFGLTWSGGTGDHFGYAPYSTERYTGTMYRTYYTHASGTGSGLVKLVDPGSTSAAYVVVNGIDKAVDSGTTFIAKWAVLSLVHSFFEAGSTTNTLRIQQLPRVEIESPTDITELTDPDEVDIQFDVDWTRWDGLPYTATGTYSEDEAELEYVLMYSNDGGSTWLHMSDDTVATPGTRPDSAYLVADANTGVETYTWNTPASSFPEGSYILRIDCYRQGAQVHYSYHKTKIFLQR